MKNPKRGECKHCSAIFYGAGHRKYCSDRCRNKTAHPAVIKTLAICKQCGESYRGRPDQKFCSHVCRINHRRVKSRSAFVEPVGLRFLIERDEGICQLCGTLVSTQIAAPHPLSPSIDHMIPLSKGGLHSKANCQLAHLYCNTSKSDRLIARFSMSPPLATPGGVKSLFWKPLEPQVHVAEFCAIFESKK